MHGGDGDQPAVAGGEVAAVPVLTDAVLMTTLATDLVTSSATSTVPPASGPVFQVQFTPSLGTANGADRQNPPAPPDR